MSKWSTVFYFKDLSKFKKLCTRKLLLTKDFICILAMSSICNIFIACEIAIYSHFCLIFKSVKLVLQHSFLGQHYLSLQQYVLKQHHVGILSWLNVGFSISSIRWLIVTSIDVSSTYDDIRMVLILARSVGPILLGQFRKFVSYMSVSCPLIILAKFPLSVQPNLQLTYR